MHKHDERNALRSTEQPICEVCAIHCDEPIPCSFIQRWRRHRHCHSCASQAAHELMGCLDKMLEEQRRKYLHSYEFSNDSKGDALLVFVEI